MIFIRLCSAVIAAAIVVAAADVALADGLSVASPRRLLVDNANRVDSGRLTATPVPLAPGTFVFPFADKLPAFPGGPLNGASYFQVMDSSFAKVGDPVYILSGLDECCASFAENGGAKLSGGKSHLVQPLYTFDGDATEVFSFPIAQDGTTTSIGERLTRHKPGNQGGPVVVPMKGGKAFVMWGNLYKETGEVASDGSVFGTFMSPDGAAVGNDIKIEYLNTGSQSPADGVQLANGRLLLIYRVSNASDILGRTQFYGRIMSPAGALLGPPFLLGANNSGEQMRAAALPNGNFVVTWTDDRVGMSVPLFRIFSPTGEPLFFAQPFVNYATSGARLDIAALSDSRFVVTGTVIASDKIALRAQLFTPIGQAIGTPVTLQTMVNPEHVGEQHIANAGYLIGTPPPAGGLATASDPRRVFVIWRLNQSGNKYDLYGQVLRATP